MSGHALRGRLLERAIARAAKLYEAEGRCELRKQVTPTATNRHGERFYSASAPIDFRGTLAGGRSMAVEAKLITTGTSLGLDGKWPEHERTALGRQHALGAWVRLVIAFDDLGETFAIDWPPLAAFLAAPYRASISLAWCRAHGDIIPDWPREDPKKRTCRFLEGAQRPFQLAAQGLVGQEVARAHHDEKNRIHTRPHNARARVGEPLATFRGLTPDQVRARLLASVDKGLERQARKRR